MDIYWYGQACFKLKGKETSLVIDPYDPQMLGLKLPKEVSGDTVLVTHPHPDHNNMGAVSTPSSERPMVFTGPGEYEIKGAIITAIESFHDDNGGAERGKNTIYHVLIDGINIVHLGDLGQKKLTEDQIARISQTDILLIPVGGVYTIDGKEASEIVAQLEAKIIIPMHYKIEGLKIDLEPVDNFLKEMGAEGVTPLLKLAISRDKLPDEPEVVVLNKS